MKEAMAVVALSGKRYEIKDSGQRAEFEGGMVRDVDKDKVAYDLIYDGPMFERWAVHLTNGAKKYTARNWMKAKGQAEKMRFKWSAFRHFIQWFRGDEDEDHASAVFFNINGYEYMKAQEPPTEVPASTPMRADWPKFHPTLTEAQACDHCQHVSRLEAHRDRESQS